jgi:NADPH-dependent 2,4-dienoyl-CoA reductase/sulfur reductase-like enzyme
MSETVLDRSGAPAVARPSASESSATTAALGASRKRIVIVGAGFAGIAAARALKNCDADVVLIDRRNHHIFQPLLYQVATAVLAPSDIAAPIRQLAEKQSNVNVVLGEVSGVDLNARSVDALCPGVGIRKIEFDYLVIATGMQPSYFGHDEFARYAPGLKSLSDAETIRAKILSAYELADTTDDENERARQMTFVLVGAGPTGVELAASMAQLAAVTLRGEFRRIDPAKNSIIVIEGGKRILPTFAERLANRAARRLEKLGVKIMTGVRVETVDEDGVVANGQRIPSATVLWTAGVAPSPIAECSGYPRSVRRRRCGICGERWSTGAWRGAGGDPAGALCRTGDRATARGTTAETSVSVFRQGQHGGCRQEFRVIGKRAPAHERVSHLARLGVPARDVASATAEPAARADPVALVLFHWAAQRAIDTGAAEGRNR